MSLRGDDILEKNILPVWTKSLVILLAALSIILLTVATERKAKVEALTETAQSICGEAMTTIEMDLRSGKPVQPSDLYAFYTITRLYPETFQAVLAEDFVNLRLDQLTELSHEERTQIADGICALYEEESEEKVEEEYNQVLDILQQAAEKRNSAE